MKRFLNLKSLPTTNRSCGKGFGRRNSKLDIGIKIFEIPGAFCRGTAAFITATYGIRLFPAELHYIEFISKAGTNMTKVRGCTGQTSGLHLSIPAVAIPIRTLGPHRRSLTSMLKPRHEERHSSTIRPISMQ